MVIAAIISLADVREEKEQQPARALFSVGPGVGPGVAPGANVYFCFEPNSPSLKTKCYSHTRTIC